MGDFRSVLRKALSRTLTHQQIIRGRSYKLFWRWPSYNIILKTRRQYWGWKRILIYYRVDSATWWLDRIDRAKYRDEDLPLFRVALAELREVVTEERGAEEARKKADEEMTKALLGL